MQLLFVWETAHSDEVGQVTWTCSFSLARGRLKCDPSAHIYHSIHFIHPPIHRRIARERANTVLLTLISFALLSSSTHMHACMREWRVSVMWINFIYSSQKHVCIRFIYSHRSLCVAAQLTRTVRRCVERFVLLCHHKWIEWNICY